MIRTATLLNESGNTIFPGTVTAPSFTCSANNQITTSGGTLALQTNGSNITVGGGSSMYINYSAALGTTPTTWI